MQHSPIFLPSNFDARDCGWFQGGRASKLPPDDCGFPVVVTNTPLPPIYSAVLP